MNLRDISIKWKASIPIALFAAFGIFVTVTITHFKTTEIVMKEMEETTLPGYRDTMLNALTTMMTSGTYSESKSDFMLQMKKIADIRIIRSNSLDRQFGKAPESAYPRTDEERSVIKTGQAVIINQDTKITGIYPYTASRDKMGKNCLECHNVREGEVIGAVSITIPISGSTERINDLELLYVVLGIAGIAGFMLILFVVFHYTHGPLKELTLSMKDIIKKNLQLSITTKGKRDEVLQLATYIDQMIDVFNDAIKKIIVSTSEIDTTVDMLRSSSEKTAQGASMQSSQASQIATTAEEMNQTIHDIARNASGAADISSEAMERATKGLEASTLSVSKMQDVFQSTVGLSTIVEKLNLKVSEIDNVVHVIKDIADQTNLLALNAAIEAARAGEQGRGFAVVADEVRKLAEKTLKATDEVTERISGVQSDSAETTEHMETASLKVTEATSSIKKLGESLNSIVSDFKGVRDRVTQIATAVEEQSTSTADVAQNIEQTAEIALSIEKGSESVQRRVEKLHSIVKDLKEYTGDFKIRGGQLISLEFAKNDHRGWVKLVKSHLSGETKLNPAKFHTHLNCRLGQWYYSEGMNICGDLPGFKELESYHVKVHEVGREAVRLHDEGKKDEAWRLYEELKEIARQVIEHIDQIISGYERRAGGYLKDVV